MTIKRSYSTDRGLSIRIVENGLSFDAGTYNIETLEKIISQERSIQTTSKPQPVELITKRQLLSQVGD